MYYTFDDLPDYKTKTSEKELIILAVYINVNLYSVTRTKEIISGLCKNIDEKFCDISEKTNYIIKILYIPVKATETKIECIFPCNINNLSDDIKNIISDKNTFKL